MREWLGGHLADTHTNTEDMDTAGHTDCYREGIAFNSTCPVRFT